MSRPQSLPAPGEQPRNDLRGQLAADARTLIELLSGFDRIPNISRFPKDLQEAVHQVGSLVEETVRGLSDATTELMANAEWDTVNIALFGETNAGKSTLVEALTHGDGATIGTGHKDHTRSTSLIRLGTVGLLDMPGIEGDEAKFQAVIREAVGRAHVVLYVIGTGKRLEERTIKKVGAYLKDQAKVYSLLNVRGRADEYRYKAGSGTPLNLVDSNLQTVARGIEAKFRELLGEQYAGQLIANAYLGFVAGGHPSDKRMLQDRAIIEMLFGSLDRAIAFSRIDHVRTLIDDLARTGPAETQVSNAYKLLHVVEDAAARLQAASDDFMGRVNLLYQVVEQAISEAEELVSHRQSQLRRLAAGAFDQLENSLIAAVTASIDRGDSESAIKKAIGDIKGTANRDLAKRTREETEALRTDLESLLKQFEQRMEIGMRFGSFDPVIDVSVILDKLRIGFGYLLKELLDVGLKIWAVIEMVALGPIIAIAGAVLLLLKKLWDWLFADPAKRKREAKQKAYDQVRKSVRASRKEYLAKVGGALDKTMQGVKQQIQGTRIYFEWFAKVGEATGERMAALTRMQLTTSTALARSLFEERVEWAFVDLRLGRCVLVGEGLTDDELSLFRVPGVEIHPTTRQFLRHAVYRTRKRVGAAAPDAFLTKVAMMVAVEFAEQD